MRDASLLMAAYLGARDKMTPRDAYAAAVRWVTAYNGYLAACSRQE
jgi:hypothetical protein